MARATSSLPVPVSPVISTVASLSATRPITFCTRRIAGLAPIRVSASSSGAAGRAAGGGAARSIRSTRSATSSRPTGLVRWSKAPSRIASMVLAALA